MSPQETLSDKSIEDGVIMRLVEAVARVNAFNGLLFEWSKEVTNCVYE
jgi:hypothetical protein